MARYRRHQDTATLRVEASSPLATQARGRSASPPTRVRAARAAPRTPARGVAACGDAGSLRRLSSLTAAVYELPLCRLLRLGWHRPRAMPGFRSVVQSRAGTGEPGGGGEPVVR